MQDGNWASVDCFGVCLGGLLFYKMKNQKLQVLPLIGPVSPFLIFITGIKNTFTSPIKQFKHGHSSVSLLCFHSTCWVGRDLVKDFIIFRQLTVAETNFSKERGNGGVVNTKIQARKVFIRGFVEEKPTPSKHKYYH